MKKKLIIIISVILFFILSLSSIYIYAKICPKLPITGANGYHLYDENNKLYTNDKNIKIKNISKELMRQFLWKIKIFINIMALIF